MLIEFTVGNYRSFKDPVTLSMVAASLVAKDSNVDENNTVAIDSELKLLKSTAIYGANASGKTNLAKAFSFVKWFMVNSSRETQSTDLIPVEPFRLSTDTQDKPSHFELVFLMDQKKYRYGFEVTRQKVVKEWLFYVPKKRETNLFSRHFDEIKISKKYDADGLQQRTRSNAFFLSVCAQFNVSIAEKILQWVDEKLQIISGLNDETYLNYTIDLLVKSTRHALDIQNLIKKLDLGFDDIQIEQRDIAIDDLPDVLSDHIRKNIVEQRSLVTSIKTGHKKFNHENSYISTERLDFFDHESKGTRKVFALAGPLIDTLNNGKILIVDEFDASLHPLISRAIVKLFHSSTTNPNNAQLVFMTHDTNLLSNQLFRRDQIWFTEKNRYAVTDLYSLAEYKIRNDASFERDYIKGRYGAIPYIGDLNHWIDAHG